MRGLVTTIATKLKRNDLKVAKPQLKHYNVITIKDRTFKTTGNKKLINNKLKVDDPKIKHYNVITIREGNGAFQLIK